MIHEATAENDSFQLGFDDVDKLGDLEMEELDNVISFADNIAARLA